MLAEVFLNTFHREHILLKLKLKEILRKIKSKNIAGVVFVFLVLVRVSSLLTAQYIYITIMLRWMLMRRLTFIQLEIYVYCAHVNYFGYLKNKIKTPKMSYTFIYSGIPINVCIFTRIPVWDPH